MKVAFQGEPGAYSEQAVFNYFGIIETRPSESFDVVFDSVVSGECEYGLIPIENSLAGSIHQNYDLFLHHDLHIIGEYFLRVQHCLIALPGVAKADTPANICDHEMLVTLRCRVVHADCRSRHGRDTGRSIRPQLQPPARGG